MVIVPLSAIPNQKVSIRLEGALFDLTIRTARNLMAVTIAKDGKPVVSGQRCLPDTPLIPYRYLEGLTGNFYFFTAKGEYPHYSRFTGTDELVYATASELEVLRNGNA